MFGQISMNTNLDDFGNPTAVAGVPPDYFSPTGQRWGNPLYRWDVMKAGGYRWWLERIRALLKLVDIHSHRPFSRIRSLLGDSRPDEPTAIKGRWVEGPGATLFEAIKAALGRVAHHCRGPGRHHKRLWRSCATTLDCLA